MRSWRIPVASVLALSVVAAACGGGGGGGGGSPATPGEEEGGNVEIAGERANDHGSEDVSGASELEVEADDLYFEPTILSGTAGQEITIEVVNEGAAAHTFTIDEQGIDEELQPGADATVRVTFPDSGTVVFYCRFHRSQGMLGALQVG